MAKWSILDFFVTPFLCGYVIIKIVNPSRMRGVIMDIKKLRQLTNELEKALEELKKQTDPKTRMQIFSHFKQVYAEIKAETSEKIAS